MNPLHVRAELRWRLAILALVLCAGVVAVLLVPREASVRRAVPDPDQASLVATAPTTPKVTAVPLTTSRARLQPGHALVSAPQTVHGFATIGVTWSGGTSAGTRVWARSQTAGTWTDWVDLQYDADHQPDQGTREGRHARPGTDAFPVGAVDEVQVKVQPAEGTLPAGLELDIVDPGTDTAPAEQPPAIPAEATPTAGADAVTAASAAYRIPPRPAIYSRAQWGANEKMRDKPSLHYGEVHVGFVHHTVNANDYTRKDVPSLLRGIYAYHVKARGWSDIGYNFLVDRFGRIWEGRYGGVDRAVVGAHTLGYNEQAFAMSAIGNFEEAKPSQAMLDSYAALFAWKLALHGVSADSEQTIVGDDFPAISGHRDAGTTACPGTYLYAKLASIRTAAVQAQGSFAARQRRTALGGDPQASLVVRNTETQRAYLWRIVTAHHRLHVVKIATHVDLSGTDLLLTVGDWDGDGRGDFLARRTSDRAFLLYRGLSATGARATFAKPVALRLGTRDYSHYVPTGDVTGDGRPDLVAVDDHSVVVVLPGNGKRGVKDAFSLESKARRLVGVGLWNADGAPDFVAARANGRLRLRPGNGPGRLGPVSRTLGRVAGFVDLRGVGQVVGGPHVDLLARKAGTTELWVLPGGRKALRAPRFVTNDLSRVDLVG